jgi:Fe-S cluster assembly iron-binding protein IscA
MGKKVILFLLAFLITFFLSEIVLMQRTYSVVVGAKSLRLINNCEMVFIDKRLQPVYTVVLNCPGKDSIRL